MNILLVTPMFSQHFDSGLFWLSAFSQLGHHVQVVDYRCEQQVPKVQTDLTVIMKGETIERISQLPQPRVCYWPDLPERDPKNVERMLKWCDKVYTPVRPTPAGMTWLPTGWEPVVHGPATLEAKREGVVTFGTYTERKARFLKVMFYAPEGGKIFEVYGNGWPSHAFSGSPWQSVDRPIYLNELANRLRHAKVAVNIHRDEGVGLNRRFFEMIACCFTLTDLVPGVEEVLGPELMAQVAFRTPEEGREKLERFLKDDDWRWKMWAAELQRIEGYTYKAAAERVIKEVLDG